MNKQNYINYEYIVNNAATLLNIYKQTMIRTCLVGVSYLLAQSDLGNGDFRDAYMVK